MRNYELLKENFITWANTCEDIRAVIQVGSRARSDHPVDEWSDLDFIIFCKDVDFYMSNTEWIKNIENPLIVVPYTTVGGQPLQTTIFEGCLAIDFVFEPVRKLENFHKYGSLPDFYSMGAILLIDKDSILEPIFPKSFHPPKYKKISEEEFISSITFLWWAYIYTAKQIRRNHLWVAKTCENMFRDKLQTLIELHTHATKGWDIRTWHFGRFIEEWADPRVLDVFIKIHSTYEISDCWRALFERMKLIRWMGKEIAESMGYQYPVFPDAKATEIINKLYSDKNNN